MPQADSAALFWAKVQRGDPTECWEWTGYRINLYGKLTYGRLTVQQRQVVAHRMAWELTHGDVPKGLFVLHRCDNPPCCNPDHLFLGTKKDNVADCAAKGRREPPERGHERLRGERHHLAKLTPQDVLAIRASVGESQAALAVRYGVAEAQIWRVIHRVNWAHI